MNLFQIFLLVLYLVLAVVDWYAAVKNEKLFYKLRPYVLIPLLFWTATFAYDNLQLIPFLTGLIVTIIADKLLASHEKRNFFIGISLVLVVHLLYTFGFWQWRATGQSTGILILFVGIFMLTITFMPDEFWSKKPLIPGVKFFVLAYTVVTAATAGSAILCFYREGWDYIPSMMAAFGTVFFMFNNFIILMDKIGRGLKHTRLRSVVLYHLSKLLIMHAVVIRLVGDLW